MTQRSLADCDVIHTVLLFTLRPEATGAVVSTGADPVKRLAHVSGNTASPRLAHQADRSGDSP